MADYWISDQSMWACTEWIKSFPLEEYLALGRKLSVSIVIWMVRRPIYQNSGFSAGWSIVDRYVQTKANIHYPRPCNTYHHISSLAMIDLAS